MSRHEVWLYLETEHSFRCHCVADVATWTEAMARAQSILDGDVAKVVELFPEHVRKHWPNAAALTLTIEERRRRIRRWLYKAPGLPYELGGDADGWTLLEAPPALAAVSS